MNIDALRATILFLDLVTEAFDAETAALASAGPAASAPAAADVPKAAA